MKSRGAGVPPWPACRAARGCWEGWKSRLDINATHVPWGPRPSTASCPVAGVVCPFPGKRGPGDRSGRTVTEDSFVHRARDCDEGRGGRGSVFRKLVEAHGHRCQVISDSTLAFPGLLAAACCPSPRGHVRLSLTAFALCGLVMGFAWREPSRRKHDGSDDGATSAPSSTGTSTRLLGRRRQAREGDGVLALPLCSGAPDP